MDSYSTFEIPAAKHIARKIAEIEEFTSPEQARLDDVITSLDEQRDEFRKDMDRYQDSTMIATTGATLWVLSSISKALKDSRQKGSER